jgi:hypothetical protein
MDKLASTLRIGNGLQACLYDASLALEMPIAECFHYATLSLGLVLQVLRE